MRPSGAITHASTGVSVGTANRSTATGTPPGAGVGRSLARAGAPSIARVEARGMGAGLDGPRRVVPLEREAAGAKAAPPHRGRPERSHRAADGAPRIVRERHYAPRRRGGKAKSLRARERVIRAPGASATRGHPLQLR